MANVYLIGYGNWGKKVLNSLKKINKISSIQIKKDRLDNKKIDLKEIDWVFITSSTNQHYQLVKKYLNKKINVFCEKPLATNFLKSKKLFDLAKKNHCKLYVSDIENFKNIKLQLKKSNYIVRSKFSKNKTDILNRLAYHDFTYIYKKLKNKRIQKFDVQLKKNGFLSFNLVIDSKKFYFIYDLNSKKNTHTFNNINLRSKKNILKKMISSVIFKKMNYKKNMDIALFSIKTIQSIKKNF